MNRELVQILGYGVDTFDEEQALNYITEHRGHVVTINPEIILNATKNSKLSAIINNADLVIADGIGVEVGLKLLGHRVKRIAGIEFGKKLIVKFSKDNKPIAMVGAKPEVIKLAVEKLRNEINPNIVYSHDGYFKNDEDIINEIVNAKPELVLIALGSPKQEFFIEKLKQELPNAVMIGLGGSFDVWAGVVKRAPKIYQKLGLEWLYRTMKEPKRFKRIFPTLPLFVLKVLKERIKDNAK